MGNKTKEEIFTLYDENNKPVGKGGKMSSVKTTTEEPPYVKAYLNDLGFVMKVSNTDLAVLFHLMSYMSYGNVVDITPRIKEKIRGALNLRNIGSITNSISKLNKAFLILPLNRGSYVIDPNYFGKGSWNIIRQIHLHISYHADGSKSVKANFDKKDEPKDDKNGGIEPTENFDIEETK